MHGPSQLTDTHLRNMSDEDLNAHHEHYAGMADWAEQRERALHELAALTDGLTSENTATWLANENRQADGSAASWIGAHGRTKAELARRDEAARALAHITMILHEAADALQVNGMTASARNARRLRDHLASGDPFDPPAEEATAGAGL